MVRRFKKKDVLRKWKKEDLVKALDEINAGTISIRGAGKKYGIPKSTMQDYAKGTFVYKHTTPVIILFIFIKLTSYIMILNTLCPYALSLCLTGHSDPESSLGRAPAIPLSVENNIAGTVQECAEKGFGVSRLQLMAKTGTV
jgi:hypothetical protein